MHLKYQYQYFSEQDAIIDIFQVKAFYNSELVLTEYVAVMKSNGDTTVNQFGYALQRPYLKSCLSAKNAQIALNSYIEELRKISANYEKAQCILSSDYNKSDPTSLESIWFKKLHHDFDFRNVDFFSSVNLCLTVAEIRKSLRRSYKSLVNYDQRKLTVDIIDKSNITLNDIRNFQKFHKFVSGKSTRSTLTWDIQYEMIKSGRAFLVVIRILPNLQLLGCSLIEHSDSEALYSVGAYDRNNRNIPLGHIALFNGIIKSKAIGCKKFVVGNLLGHSNKASDKEKSISNFKSGFSTHIESNYVFKC